MSKDAIAKWSGEFEHPGAEREFRLSQADSEVRQMRLVWSLAVTCFLVYAPWDLLGGGDRSVSLLWPRLGIVLSGSLVLLVLGTERGRRYRDIVSSLVLLLAMSCYGWIIALRPGGGTGALMLLIVGSYLFSPCRFALQVVTGVFGSILALLAYAGLEGTGAPAWREYSYLLPANVLAAIALARGNHARRRLYREDRRRAREIEWRRRAQRRLEALNRRNQELLYNALPAPVARQLQANPDRRPAQTLSSVAIVFTDVVGFSRLSRELTAVRLVRMLDALFAAFDELADRHGLEKVKTIGDAYLAIANMDCAGQASLCAVNMALQQQAAATLVGRRLGLPLRVRIGIHLGPVVAGVLGRNRYAFDIWGNSVNIASRLQAAAPVGGILVSTAVSRACPSTVSFESPRVIELRGCGSIEAHTVLSDSQVAQLSGNQGRGVLG